MIRITDEIAIDESEILPDFVRASGPGGQNVDKVSTAVQIRFDAANSASLPEEVRARLVRLAGKRITKEGELIIQASRFRTQEQNRADAIERLVALIRKAAERPRVRKRTKPAAASRQRRLEAKRRRSELKKMRRSIPPGRPNT